MKVNSSFKKHHEVDEPALSHQKSSNIFCNHPPLVPGKNKRLKSLKRKVHTNEGKIKLGSTLMLNPLPSKKQNTGNPFQKMSSLNSNMTPILSNQASRNFSKMEESKLSYTPDNLISEENYISSHERSSSYTYENEESEDESQLKVLFNERMDRSEDYSSVSVIGKKV